VTAFNQMRPSGYNPGGICFWWRLGSEDPSIWSIFGTEAPNPPVEALRKIFYGYEVDFEGTGELLRVAAVPHDGERGLTVDPKTGFIASESMTITRSHLHT